MPISGLSLAHQLLTTHALAMGVGVCVLCVLQEIQAAVSESVMKFDVTANVNTLMAITGVIAYWRGERAVILL